MKRTLSARNGKRATDPVLLDQLYTVYQPIVDRHLNFMGVELLCRRQINGKVQLPGLFLNKDTAYSTWVSLTGKMLDDAVDRINEYKYYGFYTVNIPAAIAVSKELIPLVISSVLRLINLDDISMLTLEFSENTDFTRYPQAAANIRELREMGLHVLYDDCFSPTSPAGFHLPPEDIPFSGFKIDMRTVWLSQHDFNIRRKIEKLATYCQAQRLACISEGIENFADVSLMASLGVNEYQGYLISPPVSWSVLNIKRDLFRHPGTHRNETEDSACKSYS